MINDHVINFDKIAFGAMQLFQTESNNHWTFNNNPSYQKKCNTLNAYVPIKMPKKNNNIVNTSMIRYKHIRYSVII